MTIYGYDGGNWRNISSLWAYTGSVWREIQEGWVYDGATWRKFYEAVCTTTLDSVNQTTGGDGTGGCGVGKCPRTVSWTHTDADATHHIRILRSLNGGSYFEVADDRPVGFGGSGSYQEGCYSDGQSTQYKVRLEDDPGDVLACGDSGNEKTTGTISSCGIEA